jgi:hypothetical protein
MPDLSAGAEIAGYQIEATVGRGGMGSSTAPGTQRSIDG